MEKRRLSKPKSILRLKVKGSNIKPGRIPIPELLAICKEAQNAIHRQAEAIKGRKSLKPGPINSDVLEECTLELFAIGKGSAVMSFAPPDRPISDQLHMELGTAPSLLEEAVVDVVESIRAVRRDDIAGVEDGVLRSFQAMGAILANGVSEIDWTIPRDIGRKRVVAVFDQRVRAHLQASPQQPTYRMTELDGILEMADFKPSDLKCIIHATDDARIQCSFDKDLEDDVYRALRHVARVSGIGTFSGRTKRLEHVELRSVKILDPNLFDAQIFFDRQSIADLAATQGITPDTTVHRLEGVSHDEIEALLKDIYRDRA